MLQLYNGNGEKTVDLNVEGGMAKFIGVGGIGWKYQLDARESYIYNEEFTRYPGHKPWYALIEGDYNRKGLDPDITFDGNYLRWKFPSEDGSREELRPSTRFIYGVAPEQGTTNNPTYQYNPQSGADFYDPQGRMAFSINTRGYFCRQSGTGQTQNRVSGISNASSIVLPTSQYQHPIVAITMDDYAVAKSGLYNNNAAFASNAPVGTSFEYYIFDFTESLPDTNALMKMWDDSNPQKLIYNSDFFPMQIREVLKGTTGQDRGYGGRRMAGAPMTVAGRRIIRDLYCARNSNGVNQVRNVPTFDSDTEGCQEYRYNNEAYLYGTKTSVSKQIVSLAECNFDSTNGVNGGSSSDNIDQGSWETPSTCLVVDVTDIPIGRNFF